MKNKLFFLACLMILSSGLMAQPWGLSTYDQMLETAQEREALGDYVSAIEWYEKAYDEERDKNLALKLAELNFKLRDYKRSDSYYKRVLSRDKENMFMDSRYGYATMMKNSGRYEEAIEQYNMLIDSSSNEELKDQARFQLDGILLLTELDNNIDVVMKHAGKKVNSASGEFTPREYIDGDLYFGSFNRTKEIVMDGKEDDYHSKIHYATFSEKGYSKPTAFGEEINRPGFHQTSVTFSRDGRVLYFTRTQMEGTEILSQEIHYAIKTDDGWRPSEAVTGINGDWLAKDPAFGELFGEEVMFFVSDMDGGLGGFDIFYAPKMDDGNFGSPVNLGEGINSAGDDVTPYYFDGTLYLSTDGRPTIGGFDIFTTTWDGTSWSPLSNMGLNYNTAYDDHSLSLSKDGSRGFLLSNRPDDDKRRLRSETCCDDIFMFLKKEIVLDLLAVVNDESGEPLNGGNVTLINLTDSISFPSQNKEMPLGNNFQFLLEGDSEYTAVAKKEGYYPDTVKFNTVGYLDDNTIRKLFSLKEMPKVEEPSTGDGFETEIVTINQPIRLNNIYYDFDDDKILPDAEKDLNLILNLMNEYPDMVIELSSHTDAQGISRYNKQLSQRRAQSAVNWLENKGVATERMNAVGYGEDVIINHCVNGVRCSDDEHRVNRRTEFKIIEGPQTIEIKREIKKTVPYDGSKQSFEPVPVISILNDNQDLGVLKKGEAVKFEFIFENTGEADLNIRFVTGCKCSAADWPTEPISPGELGRFSVEFDTTDQKLGEIEKVLDIIANTEPIVVEARFKAVIVE